MPYILKSQRNITTASDPGQLNFLITKLCVQYLSANDLSYQRINDVMGALECAKQEFYIRVAIPYEQKKWKANGDVY